MNLLRFFIRDRGQTPMFKRPAPPAPVAALDPRKFDALGDDLSPLTKRVRRDVIAARKAEKTAALERVAEARRITKNLNQGAHQ